MEGMKVCPKCGSKNFMAIVKRGGIVETTGLDENGNPKFNLLRENKNSYDLEIVGCATCKTKLTIDDLIGGVVCKHCGKMVAPDDIDEDGNCSTCSMLIKNPELEHASQDDLLRLLAQAYRGINPTNVAIEKKIEMAEKAEAVVAQPSTTDGHTAADDILNGTTPPDVQEKKTRRKAVRKKASDTEQIPVETNEENPPQSEPEAVQKATAEQVEEVPTAEVNNAKEALAGAQEAPFPEVPAEYQAPVVPPQEELAPAQETTPTSGGFQMFDQEEDEF